MVLVAAAAIFAGASVALMLAPILALAVPLLLGRYPGEDVIRRLARREPTVRCPPRVLSKRAPRSLGRRLAPLALAGASRAPPARALI